MLAVVVVMGLACVALARWQLNRYHERKHDHDVTQTNLTAPPLPAQQLFSSTHELSDEHNWRTVTATGHYDPSNRIVVLYQSRDNARGVDVVVPLVTESGTALLVDRGFVESQRTSSTEIPPIPPPPKGKVTITGWARADSDDTGDSVEPSNGAVRSISADALKDTIPYPLYDGFVDLTREKPSVSPAPKTAEKPDLGWNTSLIYAIQWLFFGLLFFGFWGYFAWSEYRRRRSGPAKTEAVTAPESDPRPPKASRR